MHSGSLIPAAGFRLGCKLPPLCPLKAENTVNVPVGHRLPRNVPAYAIVGGNPAAVIRMRFEDGVIAKLLEIAWWDWPIEKIEANIPALERGDLSTLSEL